MISGAVDANLQAIITLFVEDVTGQTHPVDAVIDTGFSGYLTLPLAQIASLGLLWLCKDQAVYADGSVKLIDVYTASIIWDTQSRLVRISESDTTPLVGMKLLEGNEVLIRVIVGGTVRIDAVP
jgi:clan AA aspartic protease